jgi:hypothetical protein
MKINSMLRHVHASGVSLSLPLFDWADARSDTSPSFLQPLAARVLAARYGLSPLRARLVAELAGLALEANANG